MAQGVLDLVKTDYWSFIPRRGSGRRGEVTVGPDVAGARDRSRARAVRSSRQRRLTALFAEQRPEVIEEMRAAADGLRAELAGETVTFVVNRNINVSNVCTVGCAFCGFGQGKRSPDAYEHSEEDFARRIDEAVDFGATELCIQSGIHPDWTLETYLALAAFREISARRSCTCTPTRRWRSRTCATSQRLPPAEVFARLRDAGLGSTPGTAAEVLHDGVRERISPNKLPVARWVEIIEASHRAGLRSTAP